MSNHDTTRLYLILFVFQTYSSRSAEYTGREKQIQNHASDIEIKKQLNSRMSATLHSSQIHGNRVEEVRDTKLLAEVELKQK